MFQFDGDLKKLNAHLADKAYIEGFKVSKTDCAIFMKVFLQEIPADLVHVKRWAKHMASYSIAEMKQFPGECCCCKCDKKCTEEPKKEEEEIDLFGSDDEVDEEEQKRIEETRKKLAEAKADKKKMKKVDRSMLVIHIKPYDDQADMKMVLNTVTERVQMEGLTWGKGELLDGPFGVKIVGIACIIVDDLCSADDLCEAIINAYDDGELIQNAEIISFNKCE